MTRAMNRPPGRRLRVGVIGTGFGGLVQVPAFCAHPEVEVVAVCGGRPERARAVAERFQIPHACADETALLELDLDLVSITTPPFLHREAAVRALRGGRHVLCEKPMALSAAEAEEMLRTARASGRVHLIDHELRFNPNRQHARALIADGAIGRPRHALVTVVGMERRMPWSWWSDAERGGGILGAVGSHQIDLLRYWLGEVAAVSGLTRTFLAERPDPHTGTPRPVTSDDFAAFVLRFASGAVASVTVSAAAVAATRGARLEVWGDEGALVLDDERLWITRRGAAAAEEVTQPETLSAPPGMDYAPLWGLSFVRLVDHVVRVVLDQAPAAPAATFEDGLQTQRVMDALRAPTGAGWTEISPAGERPAR